MATLNPIIIFGTGRSGTTVFHRMLSEHPHLTWLSTFCDKYPKEPGRNRALMKALDYPLIENYLRKKVRAGECYRFWDHYARGFSAPFRDLLAQDVSMKTKKQIVDVMSEMTTDRRTRLLLKVTGWPRVGFLGEVFEDARFIHVVRDGRAVANSLLNVSFWRGWGGPEKWRWGPLSAIHQEEWLHYGRSFVVLAAIQWKILMDAAETAKQYVESGRLLEVKYEDLCERPVALFKEIAGFCDVEWNPRFEQRLSGYKLRNANNKYEEELSPQQQKDLNSVLDEHLRRYGYI